MAKTEAKEETKIKKIVLSVNGEDLVLSLAAARELQGVLNELFKGQTKTEYIPYPTWYQPTYPRPYWWSSPILYSSTTI